MIQNARQRDQDGGVGYLFRHLMEISAAPKARQLRRIRENVRGELDLLMTSPLPPRADGPTPGVRLQKFANAIAAYVASAPEHEEFERCAECGRFIREVLYFAIDDIDPLPTNLPEQTRSRVLREYVGRQFESWKARKAALRLPMQGEDVDVRQFVFAIGDLTIQECANDLTRWLGDNLNHIDNTESARYVREYIALAFSNAMLHGRGAPSGPAAATVSRTPGVFTDERRLLEFMRQAGERSPRSFGSEFLTVLSLQSPDYRLVIAPFLRRIEQFAKGSPLDRQPQAGDPELQALYTALGAA
jgi:hypothetical protein